MKFYQSQNVFDAALDRIRYLFDEFPNIIVNTSGFDSSAFDNFSVSKYAFKKKNTGMGIDLGGVYKLNKKISFSASVIDLGFIKWKSGINNYVSNNPNRTFVFNFYGYCRNRTILFTHGRCY